MQAWPCELLACNRASAEDPKGVAFLAINSNTLLAGRSLGGDTLTLKARPSEGDLGQARIADDDKGLVAACLWCVQLIRPLPFNFQPREASCKKHNVFIKVRSL